MAKLPDWIQDCREFCDSYLTEPYPRAKGAEYWRNHGSDFVQKIEQLMVRVEELESQLPTPAERAVLDAWVNWSIACEENDDPEAAFGVLMEAGEALAQERKERT